MKDNTVRQVLFGREVKMVKPKGRSQTITFPSVGGFDKERKFSYRTDDGFILTLIKMIEDLQERVAKLEPKKK